MALEDCSVLCDGVIDCGVLCDGVIDCGVFTGQPLILLTSWLDFTYFNFTARKIKLTFKLRLASVAGAVIEATARPDFEDFLRTRSPGEVVTG